MEEKEKLVKSLQRSPPQGQTPRGIWTREHAMEKGSHLFLETGSSQKEAKKIRQLPTVTGSAPAEAPINPFDFSGATCEKTVLEVVSFIGKTIELSKMLRDARYLNKDTKELAQKVVRLQKSALHIFDSKCRKNV
ncbi:uncharacterized protein DMAD_05104 [Drosophila madeirensis]|uniref:Uncharacterized protein n=1 Tax=Drosophila madeirensis TaxID=30013 RepID=A0AAU9FLG9_DROMD